MELDEALGFRFIFSSIDDKFSSMAQDMFGFCLGLNALDIEKTLQNFPILSRWYQLIADANGLRREDPLVAEAYWLGSTLLDREYDYSLLHSFFMGNYKPNKIIETPSSRNVPHHNLHVNTYGLLTKPNATADRVQKCKVEPIRFIDNSHGLSLVDSRRITFFNMLGLGFEKDAYGALHDGYLCALIDGSTAENILRYGYSRQGKTK